MLRLIVNRSSGRANMHEIMRDRNAVKLGVWRALAACVVMSGASYGSAQSPQTTPPSPNSSASGSLSVDAPERCTTREALIARVHERSKRIELVDNATPALRVTLRAQDQGDVSAELRIEWPDGQRSVRKLNAPTCAAAVDALALLITLTLDPSARPDSQSHSQADSHRTPASSAGESAGPVPASAGSQPAASQPTGPQPSASQASASQPAAPQPAARDSEALDGQAAEPESDESAAGAQDAEPFEVSHIAVGVAFEAVVGPAPRAMPGIGASALVAWNGLGLWAPLLRLRVARTWASVTESGGVADFQLDAAHLAACVVGLRAFGEAGETLAARACASGALGSLAAAGSGTYDPKSRARLWGSLGGELLLTATLVGPLELQATAGLAFPLRRDRFAFAPEVFHRVALLSFEGQVGLALRFP